MIISECSIQLFSKCAYSKKPEDKETGITEVGGQEMWDVIYTEYVDMSGAADTKECYLVKSIHNINCRLAFISEQIQLQIDCFNEFQQPFAESLKRLKEYGHRITFNGDGEDFKRQLQRVELREAKKIAERDGHMKELNQLRKEGMKSDNIKEDDRKSFIRLLNAISKHQGYGIDKEKTMADEFALMVKSHKEHYEALTENT